MIGQLKNARDKLQKVQKGEKYVSPEELAELQTKEQFWKEYCSLGSRDDKKNEMLESFSLDKTCSKWLCRSKAMSQESFENNSGCDGWISRFLAAFHFLFKV